jgi:hypothetical protein
MFILEQIKEETDPAKRAAILLDCPYYYFVAHKLDFRENLQAIGSTAEQDFFTALTNYLIATGKHREALWDLYLQKRSALKAVAQNRGQET